MLVTYNVYYIYILYYIIYIYIIYILYIYIYISPGEEKHMLDITRPISPYISHLFGFASQEILQAVDFPSGK